MKLYIFKALDLKGGIYYLLKQFNFTAHFVLILINTSPINAFNTIQFMTNIKLLHVSALECHPQGVLEQRNISQRVNVGTTLPILECLKC
jgi:hypothetical protein